MSDYHFFLPILSAVVIAVVRFLEIGAKRDTIPGRVREHWTLRVFMLVGLVMLAGSIAEFIVRGERLSWPFFVAGWICALGSFYIRRRAIAALGKFWSLHVEIRAEHQFVQSGPFRWMRHPTYFSMALELLAFGLMLKAVIMLLVIPFLYLPALLARLKIEEAALIEKFGDAYREYQRRTPAVFPCKLPPRHAKT
jgi:protein-S-isoprenylcysteine O-methyltransferase Ste14